MARIDGYPAAATLTGSEVVSGMQGGATRSISLDQIAGLTQAGLLPVFEQMIADAIAGLTPVQPQPTKLTFFDGSAATFFDGTSITFSA